MMDVDADNKRSLADSLERQVQEQAEAAKRAIREYKKTILHETVSDGVRQSKTKRDVEQAVNQYMDLRRRLDKLHADMSSREIPTRAD